MQPLARTSDADVNIVEQFQLLVNGWEICKAYSELVDPLLQQANFDKQAAAAEKGDDEAILYDAALREKLRGRVFLVVFRARLRKRSEIRRFKRQKSQRARQSEGRGRATKKS